MITIAIIDDDKRMLECICNKIDTYAKDEEIEIIKFSTGESFLAYINQRNRPDILLCDVELEGMNGVEVGRFLRNAYIETYLIYITAYSEFALDGYKLDAYQYVMKDELDTRFPKILMDVIEKIKRNNKKNKVILDGVDKIVIQYDDIIFIMKDKSSKYVRYQTRYSMYRERKTLEAAIKELGSSEFVLVERGTVVNMKHIVRLRGNTIYLDNNDEIIISSTRIAKVKKEISEYWRSRL